ncbi:MAG: hypothetical protein ACHQ01_06690, partial [Candidatus Limnocylindrales bacterium]
MTEPVATETVPSLGILEEIDNFLVVKVHIFRTALELEVIPAVAAGHRDAESIARATGCSPMPMRVLL